MNSLFKLLFVCVIGWLVLDYFSPAKRVPHHSFESSINGESFGAIDPCRNVERCVAVYLTPWCPACNASTKLVKELQQYINRSKESVGMMVIIGQDDDERQLQEMAQKLYPPVVFDADGEFAEKMGARGVPHWWVWDGERKVLEHFSGGFQGGNLTELRDYVVRDYLKLGDYFSET